MDNRGGSLNIAKSTGMLIDGALSVETPDSSGETVVIDGVDMSSFDSDDGIMLNYEHIQPEDNRKQGDERKRTNGEELIGKLVYWKKIFKLSDCESDRQEMYFRKYNEVPYVYGIFRLFDGAGHDGAKALAAIIRDCAANNEPINLRYSVEGSTLDREKNKLTSTVVRAVAITKKPCNKAASSGLMLDPNAPDGWEKNYTKEAEEDILASLTEKAESCHPLFMPIGAPRDIEVSPLIPIEHVAKSEELEDKFKLLVKAQVLLKTLTAGGGGGAPSSLTGGAALASENLRGRALAAVRDYKGRMNKAEIRAFLKHRLPEVDDGFLDHFSGVAEDFHVKKATLKAGLSKAENPKWAYHGTEKGYLQGIAARGLVPRNQTDNEQWAELADDPTKVWFTPHEDYAGDYTDPDDPSVLRFPWPQDAAVQGHVGADYVSQSSVPPQHIEIRQPDGSWKRLHEHLGMTKSEPSLPSSLVCKLESLTVELRKAAADVQNAAEKEPEKVSFAGHHVVPGKATAADGDYELLHENDTHYVARKNGNKDAEDLVRLPKAKENTHYAVHSKPVVHVADLP